MARDEELVPDREEHTGIDEPKHVGLGPLGQNKALGTDEMLAIVEVERSLRLRPPDVQGEEDLSSDLSNSAREELLRNGNWPGRWPNHC